MGKNDSLRLANYNSKHDVKSYTSREVFTGQCFKSHWANSTKNQVQDLHSSSRATTNMGIVLKVVHSKDDSKTWDEDTGRNAREA